MMSYLMTATPIAVWAVGLNRPARLGRSVASGGDVQPSLILKSIDIDRHLWRIITVGWVFLLASLLTLLSGEQLINFTLGLVFLGFGWSFVYIGASTLLVTTLPQADQPKAQMINELFIWAASAAAAGASGLILAKIGWLRLIFIASVPIGFMASLFLVSSRHRRKSWLLPASDGVLYRRETHRGRSPPFRA